MTANQEMTETGANRQDEILVVDDTQESLKLLQEFLTSAGYRVRLSDDGELALRSARIHPPALILLDIKMPGLDGYEVCRRLKQDEQTRAIPVIFLSILEDDREKAKAFESGGVDYINKPVRPAEALARVKTHLALRRAQLELEQRNAQLEEARETLEQRVRERSSELELSNRKLREQIDVHVRTLEALRQSEAKYRMIVDTANEGIWMLGEDLITTFVNARMAEMFGCGIEEMLGRPVTEFLFEEDVPDFHRRMELQRSTGKPATFENRYRGKDGKAVWALVSSTPRFEEGAFTGTFAMFTDISVRRQAEESLRLNELRYRLGQTAAHIGTWEYDPVNGRFWGSGEAKRIYGLKQEEPFFSIEKVESCIPERQRVHQALVDLLDRGAPYDIEFELRPDDGSQARYVSAVAEVYRDQHGAPVKVVGVVQDITARKRAEEAVRQSEDAVRLRERMLNESQRVGEVGGWDWDAVNDVIWWSDEYYRIFGIEPGTPPPKYLDHLRAYTPESAARLDAAVECAMGQGTPYELDLELATPTPTTRWIAARCEVKRDENGNIVGLRGTAHNITERKLAEQKLRTLNEQLDRRVRERTIALESKNAELEHANKLFIGRELRMMELKEKIRELEGGGGTA